MNMKKLINKIVRYDLIKTNRDIILSAITLLIAIIVPLFLSNYKVLVLDVGLLMGMIVVGLLVLVCFTGQLSLGQIAYYAIGAYITGYSNTVWELNPWFAVILGATIALLFGLLIGIPSFNLDGPFLAIVTIGFYKIIHIILMDWDEVTGGPFGMKGIKPLSCASLDFSKPVPFYYLTLALLVIFVIFTNRIRNSSVGRSMIAVMNDEPASVMIGINPKKVKLLSFGFSAFIAGLGGSLYAVLIGYIVPDAFKFSDSILVLAMAVISGTNAILAPVVAVIINSVPEMLRFLERYYLLIFSVVLLVFIISFAYREYKSNTEN